MTSGNNHEETYSFFEQNQFFKADPDHLVFFKQASLPAIDTNGKIVMKAKDEINQAPNGNGALFEAINSNRRIKNIINGTTYIQVIGVDNVLNKIMDPVQIGFNYTKGLEASLKCCVKVNPEEKVGVVCVKNGQYDIVEYSELTPEQAQQKREDDESRLHLELGSILIFMLESKKLLSLCASAA